MSDVCFVDTETTGLDPDAHQLWEVALITPDGNEHVWQFPVDQMKADPFALDIGRWWDRRWKQCAPGSLMAITAIYDAHKPDKRGTAVPASDLVDWAKHFRDLVGTSHLCGAVVSFDEERLRRLLHRLGALHRWHYHLIDIEALAAGFIAGSLAAMRDAKDITGEGLWAGTQTWAATEGPSPAPPWRSTDLIRAVGVNPDDFDRHTALGDARMAKAVYEAVMGR